jgi:hypothetical protein
MASQQAPIITVPIAPGSLAHAEEVGLVIGSRYRFNVIPTANGLQAEWVQTPPTGGDMYFDSQGRPMWGPQALTDPTAFDAAGAASAAQSAAQSFATSAVASEASTRSAADTAEATARAAGDATNAAAITAEASTRASAVSTLTTALAAKFATPAGTTLQYVRGDGTLATLPLQVQTDWNATSGLGQLLNKPTLGTAAAQNTSAFDTAGAAAAVAAACPAPVVAVRERKLLLIKSNINCNSGGSDVAIWTGLPALYTVDGIRICNCSTSMLLTAKMALHSGAAGTGTSLMASALLATGLNTYTDMAMDLASKSTTYGFGSLYLNNTVALGIAGTATFFLSITDLTP